MSRTALQTYDDLAALPEDSSKRYELVAGVMNVTPSPSTEHQRVAKRLFRKLDRYFESSGKGEVFFAPFDMILSRYDVFVPDIVVVLDPRTVSARALEGPAALAVEIVSPSRERYDWYTKAARYLAFGVEHYWIADPAERTLSCLGVRDGRYAVVAEGRDRDRVTDPAWPDLTIDLAGLWSARGTV